MKVTRKLRRSAERQSGAVLNAGNGKGQRQTNPLDEILDQIVGKKKREPAPSPTPKK
jgi:hypothetical protein